MNAPVPIEGKCTLAYAPPPSPTPPTPLTSRWCYGSPQGLDPRAGAQCVTLESLGPSVGLRLLFCKLGWGRLKEPWESATPTSCSRGSDVLGI